MPGLPLFCETVIFDVKHYVLTGIEFQQDSWNKKKNNIKLFYNIASVGPIGDGWIENVAKGFQEKKYKWQELKTLSSVIRSNQDSIKILTVFLVLPFLISI